MRFLILALMFLPAPLVGSSQEDEMAAADRRRLKKRIDELYFARKRVLCSYCDGKTEMPCAKCKAQGYFYVYYRGTNKVDWDKTKPCPKCEKKGKIDCPRRNCVTGFDEKNLRKILWDMRTAQFRKKLEDTLGTGEVYVTGYVRAMSLRYKDEAAKSEVDEDQIAAEMGVEPATLRSFVDSCSEYKRLTGPFSTFKVQKTGSVTVTRVRERKGGKVTREYHEESRWVLQNEEWYLENLVETSP
jgi:hypothetical protein